MARAAGWFVLAAGLAMALLGLVFLIAGRGAPGLVMLAFGMGLVALATRALRRMAAETPAALRRRVTELAAVSGGEVTTGEVAGTLGIDLIMAIEALRSLVEEGVAEDTTRDGVEYFVFPGIHEVKRIKMCPYCGNEYPLNIPGRTCASCGGNLRIVDGD